MRIGLISDTHGLLRPEAVEALAGSAAILHAGDVGNPLVPAELKTIAPLWCVRGNCDRDSWAASLPERLTLELAGLRIHLLHELERLDLDPASEGIDVVVNGHSHRPLVERRDGVLYVNPGSAGPRRFTLPVALARLDVRAGRPRARILELVPSP